MDRGHASRPGQSANGTPARVSLLDGALLAEAVVHSPPNLPRSRVGTDAKPRRTLASRGPLAVVLTVQTALSLRLMWSNTAFQDEALYLRAGHLEWSHLLHGNPMPNFPAYFSGAPVIYPPLGALADSIGGLAAARTLSLCFMLGVTGLLWATTGRLYGRRAALLAAGLFATLAGTQFLGAFATYDAMALFLMALAGWLGVRSADGQLWVRTALLLLAGVSLALADAVKYATAIFTPVVVVLAVVAVWRRHGRGAAVTAGFTVICTWLALIAAAVAAAGQQYWLGIKATTLDRPQAGVAAAVIIQRAYMWTSLILVLAVLGAVLAILSKERGRILPAVLAARRRARPRGTSPAAHDRELAEARRVRRLVRRDRGRVRDGAAEPS